MTEKFRRPGTASKIWPDEIDPEVTPPPISVPELEGKELNEQVEALNKSLEDHRKALSQIWGMRKLDDQVDILIKDVSEVAVLMREFMMPAVKGMMARVDTLEQSNSANRARAERFWEYEWPDISKTVKGIGSKLERIEKDVDRVERNVDGFIKRVEQQQATTNQQINELKSTHEQHEFRIRKIEDFNTALKAKVAVISAMVAVIAWLLSHFVLKG